MQDGEKYIEFLNIQKKFPGQFALKGVSFSVKKGEIHSLLGENGAGKSTLLNILHGVYKPTAGQIRIDGALVSFSNSFEAIQFGIAKVHQEINIVPEMTVYENVLLGAEITRYGFINRAEMIRQTDSLLSLLKCKFNATDKVKDLNAAQRQMIQIAKALQMKAKIVSFDEPTSSLSNAEQETLFEILAELKDKGITILFISHKLNEIFKICDRTTILRDGEFIGTYNISDITKESLIQKMVGRDISSYAARLKPSQAREEEILKVSGLFSATGVKDVSFSLKKGEILGFFGLVGAGRTEVMRLIFGADPISRGKISIHDKPLHKFSPDNCIKSGIGLVPENRKEQGFCKNLNNADNIALASLRAYERLFFMDAKLKLKNAEEKGRIVQLSPNDPDFMTLLLSGGNAQKVILAKWLSTEVDILILDEPTKGIDVGAKAEIYKLMEEIVGNGKSIIMVSSELPEIIGLSDRLLIMKDGRIVKEYHREEFAEEQILLSALEGM